VCFVVGRGHRLTGLLIGMPQRCEVIDPYQGSRGHGRHLDTVSAAESISAGKHIDEIALIRCRAVMVAEAPGKRVQERRAFGF
jgi:hypothetical protein